MCAPYVMEQVRQALSRRGFLGMAAGLAATAAISARAQTQVQGRSFSHVADLTHVYGPDFPMFPGAAQMKIDLLVTVKNNGFYKNTLTLDEHTGTHMDAPAHFAEGGPTAELLPVSRFVAPLAVINIQAKAERDADAEVTPDDLLAWERRNGRLPAGAFVAMYSGWESRVGDPKRYINLDAAGVQHYPGFSPAAAEFLVREREVVGIGVDTLSLDFGASKDFKTHLTVLPAGKYGLENLANLGNVPPSGATIIVGGPKHKGASGGPARVMAVW
ncbi:MULTISPECIES: cyclase family protein [unclassified Meiothermus]|uniref:cyclase family protein n=1 Tax=unclassified Meiothermus TaxID=370471 RepID=UPI000D7BB229|nr:MULTISPECIES: cyclase family protein [unclassified Meiothermus]PZA08836.1 cyclase family protein [Meiothermus sp. Pnk-1]RYM36318.1 cyclase family protein [Meiothermus sp. PNK-Is4]